jgi:hypothetical protein
VARFRVDPDRSTVTVVDRPRLDPADGTRPATVTGEVEVTDAGEIRGSVAITLVDGDGRGGDAGATVTIDLAGTTPELTTGPDRRPVVHGRASRPAGAFGLTGSPLLNPTVQLRWRLSLIPD